MGKRYLQEEMDNLSHDELVDMGVLSVEELEDGFHITDDREDPLSCTEVQLDLFPMDRFNDD